MVVDWLEPCDWENCDDPEDFGGNPFSDQPFFSWSSQIDLVLWGSVGVPTVCTVIRLADWPEGGYSNSDKDKPEIGLRRGEVLIGYGRKIVAGKENLDFRRP